MALADRTCRGGRRRHYIVDMTDVLLGILAIIAGFAMLFAGRLVLRFVIPIWGFFAGFAFGAGIVAELADERFLGTVLGWMLGLVFALVFAILAYLYYYVAVTLAMGSFGFAIGSGLVVALGIDWNWVAVVVGLVIGLVFGLVSIFANLPMIVLVVLSSFAGAVGVVGGMMLLVGSLNSADFTRGDFVDTVENGWVWSLLVLVLAFAGILIQAGHRVLMRSTVKEAWFIRGQLTQNMPAAVAGVQGPTAPGPSRCARAPTNGRADAAVCRTTAHDLIATDPETHEACPNASPEGVATSGRLAMTLRPGVDVSARSRSRTGAGAARARASLPIQGGRHLEVLMTTAG